MFWLHFYARILMPFPSKYIVFVNIFSAFQVLCPTVTPPTSSGDYAIGLEQLASMTRDHNFSALQQNGGVSQQWTYFSCFTPFYLYSTPVSWDWGLTELSCTTFYCINIIAIFHYHVPNQVKGLSNKLKTNLVTGVSGDENDLLKRRNAFGSNRYPQKKGRSFLV